MKKRKGRQTNGAPEGRLRHISFLLRDAHPTGDERPPREIEDLRKCLDLMAIMLVAIRDDQKVTFINKRGAGILGYPADEIIGRNWFDSFLPPGTRGEVKAVFEKLLAGQIEPVDYYENAVLTSGGEERLVAWHNTLLHDEEGRIIGTFSAGEDITERKLVEEKLRDSEQRYHSLFENMFTGYAYCRMIYGENGRPVDFIYLEVNDAFEKLTGISRQTVIGRRVTEAIPGIRRTKTDFFAVYGRVASTGQPTRFETYFEPLDKWLAITAYCPQRGYFIAVFDDITEKRRFEQTLRQSEEKYRSLYSSMSEGVALHEVVYGESGKAADYIVKDVNLAYEKITGIKRKQAIGSRASVLYQAGEAPYLDIYAKVAATGKPASFETYFLPMDKYFNISIFSPRQGAVRHRLLRYHRAQEG